MAKVHQGRIGFRVQRSSTLIRLVLAGWLAVLFAAGCASTNDATAPVGMKYSGGRLTAVEEVGFMPAWRACLAALNDSEITVLDSSRTVTGGKIDGRTPDLKAVRVSFRRLSETKTEMQIKVDSFGDSELTHIIYDKFKIALDPSN